MGRQVFSFLTSTDLGAISLLDGHGHYLIRSSGAKADISHEHRYELEPTFASHEPRGTSSADGPGIAESLQAEITPLAKIKQ